MAKSKDCKAPNKATASQRKIQPYPKTRTELEERFYKMADDSSRHFIAVLADAILAVPNIKAKTREAADKKVNRILNRLYKAFLKAQVDVSMASYVSLFNRLTSK